MFDKKNIASVYSAIGMLVLTAVIAFSAGHSYMKMRNPDANVDRIVAQQGFSQTKLSNYFDGIKDTPADTDVYIFKGEEPGGTVLVLGGTHANEPATAVAAALMLENTVVKKGRLIIVPYANKMGRSHTYPQDAHPQTFDIPRPDGSARTFSYGARTTNPVYEWPNPDIYIHPASGQTMAGTERSNLNRAHPGVPDGSITERLAYGFLQLVKKEKVDLAIDMHEASPEYPVVNAIVAHERAMELAAMVTMDLEMQGVSMRLEPSPAKLRGLTHREWGDNTDALAILVETPNPSAGRFRGKTDEALVLSGEDKAYVKAFGLGQLYIPYDDGTEPMDERVAKHVTTFRLLAENLEFVRENKGVIFEGIPAYEDIRTKGVGAFLAK